MPRKKKINVEEKSMTVQEELKPDFPLSQKSKRSGVWKISLLIVAGIVIIGLIIRNNKGWFLAAIVNGMPISKSEYNNRLSTRFGAQILDTLIGEKLIFAEGAKQNIALTDIEIADKIKDLEKDLGGNVSMEEFLRFQGLTKDELTERVRTQLLIDKMFSKSASVSTEEVTQYLSTMSANMKASTSAERETQAANEIHTSKVSTQFLDWFNKARDSAKVERF